MATQWLCFLFSLPYKPLIAPLVDFLSLCNHLYLKSYNWLNVLVLDPVVVLLGISRDEIPSSPVSVQPCPVLALP